MTFKLKIKEHEFRKEGRTINDLMHTLKTLIRMHQKSISMKPKTK
jgi:hypothetical protein